MIEIREITEVVKKVLSFNHDLKEINSDAPLTGTPIFANSREIVYIVLKLMEKYKIEFDAKDFDNYKFNTISGITNVVNGHLEKQK